jgi:hypothetical protein
VTGFPRAASGRLRRAGAHLAKQPAFGLGTAAFVDGFRDALEILRRERSAREIDLYPPARVVGALDGDPVPMLALAIAVAAVPVGKLRKQGTHRRTHPALCYWSDGTHAGFRRKRPDNRGEFPKSDFDSMAWGCQGSATQADS